MVSGFWIRVSFFEWPFYSTFVPKETWLSLHLDGFHDMRKGGGEDRNKTYSVCLPLFHSLVTTHVFYMVQCLFLCVNDWMYREARCLKWFLCFCDHTPTKSTWRRSAFIWVTGDIPSSSETKSGSWNQELNQRLWRTSTCCLAPQQSGTLFGGGTSLAPMVLAPFEKLI